MQIAFVWLWKPFCKKKLVKIIIIISQRPELRMTWSNVLFYLNKSKKHGDLELRKGANPMRSWKTAIYKNIILKH